MPVSLWPWWCGAETVTDMVADGLTQRGWAMGRGPWGVASAPSRRGSPLGADSLTVPRQRIRLCVNAVDPEWRSPYGGAAFARRIPGDGPRGCGRRCRV